MHGAEGVTDRRRTLLQLARVICAGLLWVLACGATAIRVGSSQAFENYPQVTGIIIIVIALVGGVGGLVGFWYTAAFLDFYVSGYRMRWLKAKACLHEAKSCLYEEFGADGMLRSIPILYRRLSDEYAPPCLIEVPIAEEWNRSTPAWASERREVILARLTKCAQGGHGRPVTFVPPGTLSSVT
jgi:hypothetical protein